MLKEKKYLQVIAAAAVLLVLFAAARMAGFDPFQGSPAGPVASAYPEETARARVLSIVEEGVLGNFGSPQPYQILSVEVLEGPYRGMVTNIDLGIRQFHTETTRVRPGETVLVLVNMRLDTGDVQAYFLDFERSKPLGWLFAAFVLVSVLISGWKGLRSLVGILFSLGMIVYFIIPLILAGRDPVLVSITGGFIFLSVTMYLVYGWNLKTHASVLGILIALSITGALSVFFVDFTRLTGFGNENALFLVQQNTNPISIRGLLLAGMLIGALGVLDDLVISQSSAVFELHAANSSLGLQFLYRRAMNIGRDHVAATVNTLVLAYAGASLPMLLLFSLNSGDYAMLANMSAVSEEIVRTLVGSIGLFLAVPVTTMLASVLVLNQHRLGRLRKVLGPENHWEAHSGHFH
jgi:uncharacterized membrane protein